MSHGLLRKCPYYLSGPLTCQLCCCLFRKRKHLDFIKNILICVLKMNEGLYGFGTRWRWVINDRVFIFGWTIPLMDLFSCAFSEWALHWTDRTPLLYFISLLSYVFIMPLHFNILFNLGLISYLYLFIYCIYILYFKKCFVDFYRFFDSLCICLMILVTENLWIPLSWLGEVSAMWSCPGQSLVSCLSVYLGSSVERRPGIRSCL